MRTIWQQGWLGYQIRADMLFARWEGGATWWKLRFHCLRAVIIAAEARVSGGGTAERIRGDGRGTDDGECPRRPVTQVVLMTVLRYVQVAGRQGSPGVRVNPRYPKISGFGDLGSTPHPRAIPSICQAAVRA
jgi:hypothetical protein